MKKLAWVPALILSLGIHAALVLPIVPRFIQILSTRSGKAPSQEGTTTVYAFAIGWCVLASIWAAMVTNVLASPTNRWGGMGVPRLAAIVVCLTLALDVINCPCLFACPPIALVVPILSYVAIFNNSMPPPEEGKP